MALALASGICLSSCSDDKELYQIDIPGSTAITADGSDIVIKEDLLEQVLLNLNFSSDGAIMASGVPTNQGAYILQASLDKNFASNVVSTTIQDQKGTNTISFTGDALNVLTVNLGLEGGATAPVYFRMVHAYNENNLANAAYSDVVSVNVTSFRIYKNWLIFAKPKETVAEAFDSLYSAAEDGVYTGFIAVNAWQGWCAYDALGTRYATDDADPFGEWPFAHMYATTADGSNMWFPGNDGCYQVTANANTGNVTYTFIKNLAVSGAATADLNCDVKTCQWTGVITTSADNQNIAVSGDTYSWDSSTGQDDGGQFTKGTEGKINISGADGVATLAEGGINIAKAGSYKLIIDLNNAQKFTYKLVDMGDVKLLPTKMTLKIGDASVDMTAEMEGELAKGIYNGFVNVSAAGDITFTDGDGEAQTVKASVENAGYYAVTLDLNAGTATTVLYGATLTVSDKWEGTLTLKDGKYSGLLTNGSGWDFNLTDENGQAYATYKSWDQYTFGVAEGDYNHFWVDNSMGDVFIEIDIANHTWTCAYENALLVVAKDAVVAPKGSDLIATLKLDGDTFSGTYDLTAKDGAGWKYYLQGMNAEKNGIVYYGCDGGWSKPESGENYACIPAERTWAEICGDYSFWVSPEAKYTMTVDLKNAKIVFVELVTPTEMAVYADDKETLIAELTAGEAGIFSGAVTYTDWNFYLIGKAGDKTLVYGSGPSFGADENNCANTLAIGGGNLWANPGTYTITVNTNDNTVTYVKAE